MFVHNVTYAWEIEEGHEWWLNLLGFLGIMILAIPSAIFNTAVAVVIWYTPKFKSEATYMAMFVLSIVDVGHCYVAFYPIGGSILTGEYQPDHENRLIAFNIIYIFWYMTCISYGTIAVNRFLAVVYPDFNQRVFSKRNMIWFLASWPVFAILCMIPILIGDCCPLDFTPKLWLLRYEEGREDEFNIQLVICYLTSATATGIGIVCYSGIFVKIYKAGSYMAVESEQYRRMKKTNINLSIQFFLLTAVFTFTWIVIHYEASLGPEKSHRLVNYLGLVGYAAMSGINPFVYFTMNKSLRRAAKQVFGKWLSHNSWLMISEYTSQPVKTKVTNNFDPDKSTTSKSPNEKGEKNGKLEDAPPGEFSPVPERRQLLEPERPIYNAVDTPIMKPKLEKEYLSDGAGSTKEYIYYACFDPTVDHSSFDYIEL